MKSEDIIKHIKSSEIKNIIVDCDAGADGDDQFALAYALTSPDRVKVLSVNSAPFNDDSLDMALAGKRECEEIIKAADLDVPALCGSPDFISRRGVPMESDAARNIRESVLSSDGPVYVIISGCCTNVASALALYPEINKKLIVVWLALDDLNGRSNTGEYNYHNDIEAGKLLFSVAENLVLVCAGKVVAPFRRTNEQIDRMFSADSALPVWLRRRFREIPWAQGLWDLCAEGAIIKPDANVFEIVKRPFFDDAGEIKGFEERSMVIVNKNDPDLIITDAVDRINGWRNAT